MVFLLPLAGEGGLRRRSDEGSRCLSAAYSVDAGLSGEGYRPLNRRLRRHLLPQEGEGIQRMASLFHMQLPCRPDGRLRMRPGWGFLARNRRRWRPASRVSRIHSKDAVQRPYNNCPHLNCLSDWGHSTPITRCSRILGFWILFFALDFALCPLLITTMGSFAMAASGKSISFVILCALAAFALAQPSQSAEVGASEARAALTAMPENLPYFKSLDRLGLPSIEDAANLQGALQGPATDQPVQLSGRAPDQVAAVTVQALRPGSDYTPGPAWWKVSSPAATVWIMATPDRMPASVKFDERPLAARIAASRALILPANFGIQTDKWLYGRNPPADTSLRLPTDRLFQRLPPGLADRLKLRLQDNEVRADSVSKLLRGFRGARSTRADTGPYLEVLRKAPNELSSTLRVAIRLSRRQDLPDATENPVAARAASIASRAGIGIDWMRWSQNDLVGLADYFEPSEDVQQACLSRILDDLDAGWRGEALRQSIESWAVGDAVHAPKRYNTITTCSFGPAGSQLWNEIVSGYVDAVDKAMASPGQVVAIVEFDPLLIKGGVLDQLRAKGYAIQSPAGM
ncbi:MAG: polysaccharide biosynthesis protein GumN [Caulobacteraceae bacterium]|nr:polysaccharide biosynthesis protein GumN [Caulobacteraceae bacterium]